MAEYGRDINLKNAIALTGESDCDEYKPHPLSKKLKGLRARKCIDCGQDISKHKYECTTDDLKFALAANQGNI